MSSPGEMDASHPAQTRRSREPGIQFLLLTGVYFQEVRLVSRQALGLSEAGLGPAQAFERLLRLCSALMAHRLMRRSLGAWWFVSRQSQPNRCY